MIDIDGYRQNVGIVICNVLGNVLWAKRCRQNAWQFPQGGIKFGETAEDAMYRELLEEVGLCDKNVYILSSIHKWLCYKLPKHLLRNHARPICIGQKQKWFLIKIICQDKYINLKNNEQSEFDNWRWVSFWYPLRYVIKFKREVYRKVMSEFSKVIIL